MSIDRRRCSCVFFPIILLASGMVWAQPSIESFNKAYDQLVALDDATLSLPREERLQRLTDAYNAAFAPLVESSRIADIPEAELETVLRASQRLAYYTDDERYLQQMSLVMKALGSSAGPDALKRYHQTLLQFRRFADAAQLARRHPGLSFEPTPDVVMADPAVQPNAYAIDQGNRRLREIHVPLRGDTLVVIVHPRCRFSVSAMGDLRNTPLLRGLALVWLAPVGLHLDYEVLEAWNTTHTDQSIVLARHAADWAMIDSWSTPSFYLMHDGKVVAHFSGWPQEGNWMQLRALLAKRSGGRIEPVATEHSDAGRSSSTD
ncbi:hypothetical protein [Xanthomonas nasturtii]|uniref:hypothetical protein n=1 Tax=Xanthomonas nasturtii TaxID=1843581 RepID=UPI002011F6AE|nr:hypothetical protein [Xanthomonas nasturtii]MCL1501070.1 hypothetical protein [Xanthomonas nasturtii]MCL1504761.1 hypothetical protein [Xanthomonas nasturtii]MCL1524452.1 hypothetical protein [Xanthomonas nasturtii]